jgi:hypothetical protein
LSQITAALSVKKCKGKKVLHLQYFTYLNFDWQASPDKKGKKEKVRPSTLKVNLLQVR